MIARLIVALVAVNVVFAAVVLGTGSDAVGLQVPWKPVAMLAVFAGAVAVTRLRRAGRV